jgi:osomolarity two-component system sensor histidine kinase SLN1
LKAFYLESLTSSAYDAAINDVSGALASGGYSSLLQMVVFSRNATGNSTGLLKATANAPGITLPATYVNGTPAMLGDKTDLGYPTALYP